MEEQMNQMPVFSYYMPFMVRPHQVPSSNNGSSSACPTIGSMYNLGDFTQPPFIPSSMPTNSTPGGTAGATTLPQQMQANAPPVKIGAPPLTTATATIVTNGPYSRTTSRQKGDAARKLFKKIPVGADEIECIRCRNKEKKKTCKSICGDTKCSGKCKDFFETQWKINGHKLKLNKKKCMTDSYTYTGCTASRHGNNNVKVCLNCEMVLIYNDKCRCQRLLKQQLLEQQYGQQDDDDEQHQEEPYYSQQQQPQQQQQQQLSLQPQQQQMTLPAPLAMMPHFQPQHYFHPHFVPSQPMPFGNQPQFLPSVVVGGPSHQIGPDGRPIVYVAPHYPQAYRSM